MRTRLVLPLIALALVTGVSFARARPPDKNEKDEKGSKVKESKTIATPEPVTRINASRTSC